MKKMKKKNNSKPNNDIKNSKEIILNGTVLTAHPNACFDVMLDNGHIVFCTISGKLRKNYIHILPDDKVQIGITPYDLTRGRIKYRYRKDEIV